MKNPNAFAAAAAGAVVMGAQYLANAYMHAKLSLFWSDFLDTSVISLILLVGRDGVWGALQRGWAFIKSGAAGSSSGASGASSK